MTLLDKFEPGCFVTHSGTFHSDDTLATVLFNIAYDDFRVFRTRDITDEIKNAASMIYDIGGGEYDHHLEEKYDSEGNILSSIGLIWKNKENGIAYRVMNNVVKEFEIENIDDEVLDKAYDLIFREFINKVDNDDNGKSKSISQYSQIVHFYLTYKDHNKFFENAVKDLTPVIKNSIRRLIELSKDTKKLESYIKKSEGSRILEMESHVSWYKYLKVNNLLNKFDYVMYPTTNNEYALEVTPSNKGKFNLKNPLPEEWRGKENNELELLTGVKGTIFCHLSGFIIFCNSKDSISELIYKNKEKLSPGLLNQLNKKEESLSWN